jgi:hypothetical protein
MVIYKSASLTWIGREPHVLRLLLCREYRKNKLLYHPIGGKYEEYDTNISITAIREFLEESNILQNHDFKTYIQEKYPDDDFSNTKALKGAKKVDPLYQSTMTYFLQHILPKTYVYDYYVNQERQYIHRYYLIEMENVEEWLQKILYVAPTWYQKSSNESIEELVWNRGLRSTKKTHTQLSFYLFLFLQKKEKEKEKCIPSTSDIDIE